MKKLILATFGVLLISLMIASPVLAQPTAPPATTSTSSGNGNFEIQNPINATSISALIDEVANFIFLTGLVLAPVMILVAAFYFLTAAGNQERVTKARQILMWTLIGLAVLYMSNILIDVIQQVLGVQVI